MQGSCKLPSTYKTWKIVNDRVSRFPQRSTRNDDKQIKLLLMRPTTQGLHKVGWGSQQAPSPFLGMHVLWSRTSCWQRVYQQPLCSPKEPLLLLLDRTIQRLTKFAGKEIVSACPRVDSCPTQATFRPIFRKRLFTPCESCSSVKLQWARHRARRPFLISQTVIQIILRVGRVGVEMENDILPNDGSAIDEEGGRRGKARSRKRKEGRRSWSAREKNDSRAWMEFEPETSCKREISTTLTISIPQSNESLCIVW